MIDVLNINDDKNISHSKLFLINVWIIWNEINFWDTNLKLFDYEKNIINIQ